MWQVAGGGRDCSVGAAMARHKQAATPKGPYARSWPQTSLPGNHNIAGG